MTLLKSSRIMQDHVQHRKLALKEGFGLNCREAFKRGAKIYREAVFVKKFFTCLLFKASFCIPSLCSVKIICRRYL